MRFSYTKGLNKKSLSLSSVRGFKDTMVLILDEIREAFST